MSDRGPLALVLGLGALLVGACAYVLFGIDETAPVVTSRVVVVSPEGPDRIRVTFEVEKGVDVAALCQVAAFAEDGTSAGRLNDVTVPEGEPTTRLTVVVPTSEEAADASISQCVGRRVEG